MTKEQLDSLTRVYGELKDLLNDGQFLLEVNTATVMALSTASAVIQQQIVVNNV